MKRTITKMTDSALLEFWRIYGSNKQAAFYPQLKRIRNIAWAEMKKRGLTIPDSLAPIERPDGYMDPDNIVSWDSAGKVATLASGRRVHRRGWMYGWGLGGL
ncbi:MAG: hypothetical protein ACYCYO_01905 [Bacilli bacterium]